MKFNLNKIVMALPAVAACSAYAAMPANDIDGGQLAIAQVESTYDLTKNKKKTAIDNQYIVILEDAPLASYHGGIANYQATSRFGSKGDNLTAKGKLNTRSLASKRYVDLLSGKQQEAKLHIELRLKRDLTVISQNQVLLNSLITELSASEALLLQKMSGVKAVSKLQMQYIDSDRGPAYAGADKAWDNFSGGQWTTPEGDVRHFGKMGEGVTVAILDSGIASYLDSVADINDIDNLPKFHPSFDQHQYGPNGEIAYTHSNHNWNDEDAVNGYYGDCIDAPGWCNDKLIGVRAFGQLAKDMINRDENESRNNNGQDVNGHGTHTASTAAGNIVYNVSTEGEIGGPIPDIYDHNYVFEAISGVAPRANIISYQVCAPDGGCIPALVLEALEVAVEDGADVVNYSVSGFAESPWYSWIGHAFLNLRDAGVHASTSAGNTGANGPGSIRTPGNSPWVTGVGAYTSDRAFDNKIVSFTGGEYQLANFEGEGITQGLAAADIVQAKDHEESSSENDTGIVGSCALDSLISDEVSGKVVVCRRGGLDNKGTPLSRVSKSHAVHVAGGAGMILINTPDTRDSINEDFHSVPAIHIDKNQAELLLEWLETGDNHQVEISQTALVPHEGEESLAGIMGGFSAQGPDIYNGDYLTPSISATGVSVLAAGLGEGMQTYNTAEYARTDQDFRYMSGTSMSAPHIAGMYALIKAERPEWSPAEAQSALMLTAGTDVRTFDKVVDGFNTFKTAEFFRSGAGRSRVDLAINSALIMHETREGYLAADPYGDDPSIVMPGSPAGDEGEQPTNPGDLEDGEDYVKPLPEGWHGEPSRMNLASMTKKDCEYKCAWTRTFTPTKDATWNVSFTHNNNGMDLSTDKMVINATAGVPFDLTVTADVNSDIDALWLNSRVHLTANDETIPAVSIPVAVNFITGTVPETIAINAQRNSDQIYISGIETIGTDDLTVTHSALNKAEIFEGQALRNDTPLEVYRAVDTSTISFPINIPAFTERFVVEVVSTSSPDLDIYVGVDTDLDGKPTVYELNQIYFWGITDAAKEVISYDNPRPGVYWIMIHNFGNTYNDSEHEDFDPEMVKLDDIKVAVSLVGADDNTMIFDAPKSVKRFQQVPLSLTWQDDDMTEGDYYYGKVRLGTSEELTSNIGTADVNIVRGEDDVKISPLSTEVSGSTSAFEVKVAANPTANTQTFDVTIELVAGTSLETFVEANQQAGMALKVAGEEVNYTMEDGVISFSVEQAPIAKAQKMDLVINHASVEGYTDVTPIVRSFKNAGDFEQISKNLTPMMVEGNPIFDVYVSANTVKKGETITLAATTVDAVIANAEMTYSWQQVSGPKVSFEGSGDTVSFKAPGSESNKVIGIELVGSNGARSSNPVLVEVELKGEGGGSTGIAFILLSVVSLLTRRTFTS